VCLELELARGKDRRHSPHREILGLDAVVRGNLAKFRVLVGLFDLTDRFPYDLQATSVFLVFMRGLSAVIQGHTDVLD